MMLATLDSAGSAASRSDRPISSPRPRPDGNVELDDLHAAVGEHVGLAGGREADEAGDRVGGLELGGDHEVDVDVPLAPRLQVLDVGGAHDRARPGQPLDEHRRHQVGLVARGSDHDQVRFRHAGLLQRPPARAVALDGADVVAVGKRAEAPFVEVDHRDCVLAVERFDERAPDVACADDDDLHGASVVARVARGGHASTS